MPKPGYDIDDETGKVTREQIGNIPGTPGFRGGGTVRPDDWPGAAPPPAPVTTPVPTQVHGSAPATYLWSDFFRQQATSAPQYNNPYSNINSEGARQEQQRVIQDLQRQAAGDLNSLAQQQLRQGYGAAQAQQSSLGATLRGQGAGAAMRGAQQGQQNIQRGFAGDQQMLQVQEQQAAQAMLAQLLAQQHQQDIGAAQGMAQGQIGAAGLSDAMRQFYLGSGVAADVASQNIANEQAAATLGFGLQGKSISDNMASSLMGLGAGAAGTAFSIYNKPPSSGGYRQVDGQNSIVPYEDK